MHVEKYPELLDIVRFYKRRLIESDPSTLLWQREGEEDPFAVDLSFHPEISEKTVETFLQSDVCTLCERRISYKTLIQNEPSLPYLILIHNSFVGDHGRFFEDSAVNDLFLRMIQAGLGADARQFRVREALRCFFGQKEESDPAHFVNCQKHLIDDLSRDNIRGILIIGQAAPIVFGNNKQKMEQAAGKVSEFFGLPAVVCPGPTRIKVMEERKMPLAQINDEKRKIINILSIFKKEVMKM